MNETKLVPANSRGGTVLVHNGFRYTRRNKTVNKVYWQCTFTACGAYLHTNQFDVNDDSSIQGSLLIILQVIAFVFICTFHDSTAMKQNRNCC